MLTDIVWNGLELQADVYVPRHPSADDTPEVNGIHCTGVADEDEWAQFRADYEIETGDQQTDAEQAIDMFESDIADQMIQQARQSRRSHRRESRDVVEEAITQLVEQDRRNPATDQGPIEKYATKCVADYAKRYYVEASEELSGSTKDFLLAWTMSKTLNMAKSKIRAEFGTVEGEGITKELFVSTWLEDAGQVYGDIGKEEEFPYDELESFVSGLLL